MAKVIKPSVSPVQIGQRPKKKSPLEDFAGTLNVQAGKTFGNAPARTASAEGQKNQAALPLAAKGHGRFSPSSVLSSHQEGPSPAKSGDLAVRPEKTRGRALPTPSSTEALKTAELPVKELKPAAPKASQTASPSEPLAAFAPQRQVAITKATPATPSAQLAQLMLSRAPEPGGTVKAELTLYPEHLGVVQVQLSVDPSGALSAVVFASAQAIDQLGVADLRSALQGAGLNLQDLDLRRQNKRQFEQGAKRSAVTLSEPQTALIQPQAHIQGGSYLDMNL